MEFRQKMEELGNYMDHRAMGDATQQKLINHFEYLYMVQYGKEELSILEQLPTSLRKEVSASLTPVLAQPVPPAHPVPSPHTLLTR